MGKAGFIGLGIMGVPMAKNLIAAGHSLVVYDVVDNAAQKLVAVGAERGASPADVASKADEVIFTMLPDSPQVSEVVTGKDGIIHGCRKGQIVVDMSSIAPLESRRLGEILAERGVEMIDAPVSGGQEKAEKGTLAIMAGGKREVFDRVKDVLSKMGASVSLVGDLGAGQVTKLVNQMIVGVNIAAIAEGMSLAKKSGVEPRKVFEAIRKGLAGSQCLEDKAPRMFEGRYDPGFRIALHIKDYWNVLVTSRAVGSAAPLSAQVTEMMIALAGDGHDILDHGALGLYYEKLNGVSLKEPG
ncbi:MAG: 2-hydroxy-3-oxopropionate reductase [Synergistaceae bacterium]|jgi:2-hydroxy-3-oxopropionate reductase|nr:2-hydroxy-3-oxopropionate reductase [Synergistaceae bacterium]